MAQTAQEWIVNRPQDQRIPRYAASARLRHRPGPDPVTPDASRPERTPAHPAAYAVAAALTIPSTARASRSITAVAVPGRRLGGYRLIEPRRPGRQADVWRAVKLEPPVEEVALKLLPASSSTQDPRRLAQLRREAERGSRLVSPALLPTYEFGEADGLVFLAMPLVVGCSLGAVLDHRREFIAGGDPPPGAHRLATAPSPVYDRTITALMARVARAVSAAHASRVVHRDIKPMNILVRRDLTLLPPHRGNEPAPGDPASKDAGVFLCDFGLGRDLDVATPRQLRDGAGSPLYMAPERLRKQPADEVRCDVFALGVTLFEALTLTPPVEVPPEMPQPRWAAFLAAARPRRLRQLRRELPLALEDVVHRAMARDPYERHASAGHLADELDGVVDREFPGF
ncbi:MAG: serine/threonine-protein kinase [Isosphaeraceae bacterium]